MSSVTKPALRYHGAKFRLAPWILEHFPPHRCYVEPFGGAAGVLLQKPRAYAEVYNDLDGEICNFFRVLRDPEQASKLLAQIELTPYARDEFDLSYESVSDPIEAARRTAVRASMGFGSAGATKGKTGFRCDTRRAYSTAQHQWARYPAALKPVIDRLQGVLIENRPAIDVIRQHDAPDTLHFVDPPYLHDTRVLQGSGGRGYYRHEMTDAEHLDLIAALRKVKGMVILCGYPSKLYDDNLQGWTTEQRTARIAAGRGTGLRIEQIWMNPAAARVIPAPQLLIA
ncbi:DNA adenine methylase [Comamonas testosteroni]|uniref:DNA adenine methylase n=1 Tax=Comamonas testosteroni TaxID=285 RepID=UPI0005B374E3|nr:DNA adenine methylase [Comamonas testosteroni]